MVAGRPNSLLGRLAPPRALSYIFRSAAFRPQPDLRVPVLGIDHRRCFIQRFASPATPVVAVLGLAIASAALGGGCPGDLDGDGTVGSGDLSILLGAWGNSGKGLSGDLDGDGAVGPADLAMLLAAWGPCPVAGAPIAVELAARPLGAFPWADAVASFNQASAVHVAVDPARIAGLANATVAAYIVADRSAAEWATDTTLVDVRGAPQSITLGSSIADSVIPLDTSGLPGADGLKIATGFDLVLDVDGDGALSGGDLIDGLGDEAGFWIVTDLTVFGPLAVSQVGSFDTNVPAIPATFQLQRIYYPTDVQNMSPRPLVVISHGNGHQYTWYDWIGQHLASWGYIVMAHQNNTGAGVEAASTTTLQHTDAIIALQGAIGGGAFAGKLDASRIVWIGHSRGGEGVARAYDRLFDGTYTPANYGISAIKLVSSIAPTDFLGTNSANPHGVPYHLLYGSADGDVCGCPDNDVADSFNVFERAVGERASFYLHGADHNDFNCCGFNDFSGPANTQIGRPAAQLAARAAYLPLIRHVLDAEPAAREFLWRPYDSLRPLGVGANLIAVLDYRRPAPENPVIDDFQNGTALGLSSSGGAVVFDVLNPLKGVMHDANTSFTWLASDAWNGMTRGRTSDTQRGMVFDYTAPSFVSFEVVPALRDFTSAKYLSLRLAQGTRHPRTVALNGQLTFTMTLEDVHGTTASLALAPYTSGIRRPYQRTGFGTGAGWQNEFETVRFRLGDFLVGDTQLDLSAIASIRLSFGQGFGSSQGRIAIDDLRLDVH